MWDWEILGIDFYYIVHWFFIYSFFGWLMESTYVSIQKKKIVNRGFVNGPFCTIYGTGALAVYLILRPLEGHYILIYFGGVLTASILEYATSFLMEKIFHASWWDYSDEPFNLNGRICLWVSLVWGLLSVAIFLIFQPAVEWITALYSRRMGEVIGTVVLICFTADFIISAVYAMNLKQRIQSMASAVNEFVDHIDKIHLYESRQEILDRLDKLKVTAMIRETKEKWERSKQAEDGQKSSYRAEIEEKLSDIVVQYEKLKTSRNIIYKRILKAYPKWNAKDRQKYALELKTRLLKKKGEEEGN